MANSFTGDPRTPAWVVNVREEISRSPAWEVLSDQLYERVSTVLESHGLGHFSDLSAAEQITLLEEAHRDISSEDNKDEAAKRDGTDEALYLDRILDSAAEGAVSLLRELPREHLGSLRLMLNQPVPSRARLDIWRLMLKHTAVREEYELLMKQNRNSTISGQDIYITHRCQALLESGRVASRHLLPLTSLNVVLMKTVLSYHHARKMGKHENKAAPDVPESFVHFLVPLCAVATSSSNLREHKIESQIEGLVEMFEGALEAGLEGFVDPKELGGGSSNANSGDGGEAGGAGSAATTRAKKAQKPLKPARGTEPPASVGGGAAGDVVLPSWVAKVHDVLVPGFKELVDHVARVHLGLAVAAPVEGGASEHKKEGGSDGNDDDAPSRAANGKAEENDTKQHRSEGDSAAKPSPLRRISSKSRRASLQSRRLTGGPTADAADGEGGGEDTQARDTFAGHPSADDFKKDSSIPISPPPSVNDSQARAALYALLKPLVTVGLVGYLGADVCLFAWDQAVIGGFGVMLPRVAAMVVAAAADKMKACSTFTVMSEALVSHAHVVSTSQLQGLMEVHCMPSIQKEMRVSQKLSPEIVGPSLETATEILHRAYSKRTREIQKARKEHVEHVLGPSEGGGNTRISTKERCRLNLPRSTAHGSGGSSEGASSVDLQYDDVDDDHDDDDDDGDDDVEDTQGKTSRSVPPGRVGGGLGGRQRPNKDGNRGSKKNGTWRGMLSHRSASSNAASVDRVGKEKIARAKTTGDHGSTRSKPASKRDTKKGKGATPSKRDAKEVEGAASSKRGTKKAEGAASSTSGSASTNVISSVRRAESKKTRNKEEQDLPDADHNAKTKPKTIAKRHSGDHYPSNESADDSKRSRNPKEANSQKRPTAGGTAVATRKYSSASSSSSLAQESTGRSLESSQYFSAESESPHTRDGENESGKDDKRETALREESATRPSDGIHRSKSNRRKRRQHEESSVATLDDESDVSVDGQAGNKRPEKSSTRLGTRTISNTMTDRGDADDGADKSAKGSYKTREASSRQKKAGRTVTVENNISEGGAPAAAASPEPAATSTSSLKRWLGFGGRKKASPPSSPAMETKTPSRTKTKKNLSNWMLD
eukprot:g9393.t1